MSINRKLESNLIPISPSGTEDELASSSNFERVFNKNTKLNEKKYLNEVIAENNDSSSNNELPLKKNPHLIYSKYDPNMNSKKSSKKMTKEYKKDHYLDDSNYSSDPYSKKYEYQIQKLTSEISDLKKQMYKIRQDNLNLQEENSYVKLEKEKTIKIKNNEISLLNEKLINSDEQNKKLISENEMKSKQIDEYTPKIWKYDELNDKYTNLTKENDKLLTSNNNLNELLTNIKRENCDSNSKYETLKLENDNLKQDKIYLNKNNMLNEQKIKDQNEKIKQLEKEMIDIRKKNQDYIEKLTDKNINLDNTYKDKVNTELDAMKAKYEKDILNLKSQYDDLTNKQTAYLREEKDEYKNKCNKYEKNLKDKDDTISMISNELRTFQTKTNEEISNLKLQLNIKTEELNSRTNAYEEVSQTLTVLKNDHENLKEKNDLLRSELIKKESTLHAEIADYKAQLSVLKEKINSYENIENELDKTICQNALDADKNSELLNIIKDIPTSSKRRISQCLALANKVKLLTVENEKLSNMNQQINNELTVLRDQTEVYKSVADKVNQPVNYLINDIRNYQLEIFQLKQDNQKKDQTINRLSKENEFYQEKVDALGSDLKAIVGNRQQLTNLESVITSFMQNDNNMNNMNSNTINGNYNTNYSMMMSNPMNLSKVGGTYSNNIGTVNNLSMNMNNAAMSQLSQVPEKDNVNMGSYAENMSYNSNFNNSGNINSTGKVPNWYLKLQSKKQYA